MSSNNASSTVTYASVSSDSNGPSSWGIPLENAGEIPDVDPYEKVAQQGQAHPLSPAYAEDQPYAKDASPTTESPGYIADSKPMEDDTDADSIDYPDKPGTDDEDEDEDPEEDPGKEHEPENEDAKEDESFEDSDEIEPFEENETAATPPPPRHHGARISVRPQTPMTASTQALIDAYAARLLPPSPLHLPSPPLINPTYDQTSLGHRAAMIPESSAAAAARASRGQYDFVDAIGTGQGLIHSPAHDIQTIARAADRVGDVGYVRALQTSEHMMMTSIEEVNLRVSYQAQVRRQESEIFYTQLHDARTDRKDIRLEIDVVSSQRTAYETELHEVRQAYLSSEA
ncbi:hypothetical protein Tco_0180042 [Tanacetum coccineum]